MNFFTSRASCRMIDGIVVIATLAPIVYLASQYADLPERVPVHWNLYGKADRFVMRGFFPVFFPSMLSVLLQVLFTMLSHDLLTAWENARGGSEESRARAAFLAANLGLLQTIRLPLLMLLGLVVLALPLTGSNGHSPSWWTIAMAASVVLLLVTVIGGAIRIWMMQEKWEAVAATSSPEFQDESWRWGGAVYSNAADPELIVPKKLGAGFTLNFAHRRAKMYLAYFVLMSVFIVVAASQLK